MRERSGNPIASDGHASKSALWSVASMTADRALDTRGNSVYSPACIFEGLCALSLGAAGLTKKELKEIVGDRLPKGDWLGLERRSKWAYGNYAGRVLTGVWLDEAAEPEREFEIACKKNDISVARADLSAPDAGAEISRWISDATDGFITPSIDLDPLALACVSSVLYLKDAWENSFSKRNTERAAFHAIDGLSLIHI